MRLSSINKYEQILTANADKLKGTDCYKKTASFISNEIKKLEIDLLQCNKNRKKEKPVLKEIRDLYSASDKFVLLEGKKYAENLGAKISYKSIFLDFIDSIGNLKSKNYSEKKFTNFCPIVDRINDNLEKLKSQEFEIPKRVGFYKKKYLDSNDKFAYYNFLTRTITYNPFINWGKKIPNYDAISHEMGHFEYKKFFKFDKVIKENRELIVDELFKCFKSDFNEAGEEFSEKEEIELRKFAYCFTSRTEEFVAHIFSIMQNHNWDWSIFNPKIKMIYEKVGGPLPKKVD